MTSATTVDVSTTYETLDAMHGPRGWHWWPDGDPFEVIVGCILVQNTMWTNVERALERLREANALTAEAMSVLTPDDLEKLVQPSGQFRQKAKKLRAFLDLVHAHRGLEPLLALPAPELRAALLATWGIGEETADAIVLYASRQATVVIDAYAQRFFGRLGLGPTHTTKYGEWQRWFAATFPSSPRPTESLRDYYARFHALTTMHCKHLCLKSRPKCHDCAFHPVCPGSPTPVATPECSLPSLKAAMA